MKQRRLLFSVTMKDLEMQTFSVGGHGGGGKDTSNSGVRLIHRESGAVGEGREHRSNTQNRKAAFERLANSPKFKAWHKIKCAELIYGIKPKTIDELLDEAMQPENLKIETT
jgi:protein subunit release factor A